MIARSIGSIGDASAASAPTDGAIVPAGWFGDQIERELGRAEGLGVGFVVGGLTGALATMVALFYFGGRK